MPRGSRVPNTQHQRRANTLVLCQNETIANPDAVPGPLPLHLAKGWPGVAFAAAARGQCGTGAGAECEIGCG